MEIIEKLNKLKVSTRIYILVAIAIVATVTLASTSFIGDRIVDAALDRDTNFTEMTMLSQEIEIAALGMRRAEKDFLLRKKDKYVKKYLNATNQADQTLLELANNPAASMVAEKIKNLTTGIAEHKQQFLKVVELNKTIGLDEKSGLQGQLRQAIRTAEAKLKTINRDTLTVTMLMMRRHEKDFILRGKEKYIARIAKRRQEFDGKIAKENLSAADITELNTLMDAYVGLFNKYAATAITLKSETKKLSTIFAKVSLNFKSITDLIIQEKTQEQKGLAEIQVLIDRILLSSSLGVIILAIASGLLIGKSINGPILSLTNAMNRLADGDTSVDIVGVDSTSELGNMARTVEVFKQNAIDKVKLEEDQKKHAEQSKLEKRKTMQNLANQFDASVGSIIGTISSASTELNATAQSMATISEETTTQITAVAASSQQTSTNVQTVAAATEEMIHSITEINGQVTQASVAARRAVEDVTKTSGQMDNLAQTADKIGAVVLMISDIAEQTNLLALNATIESARAGEAGKGFAVVAGEVKALASETAKATESISQHITEIQTAAGEAVNSINEIGQVVEQLEESSTTIASAMEEQRATVQEVARSVQEVSSGSQEVTTNIDGVTQASQETGAAATQVSSAAGELSEQAESLKNEVSEFLEELRRGAADRRMAGNRTYEGPERRTRERQSA